MPFRNILTVILIIGVILPLIAQDTLGEGFFIPKTQHVETLFLYAIPNSKAGRQERPIDSITFVMRNGHATAIKHAPAYFSSFNEKLDYAIFMLKVTKLGIDYHEIMINEATQKTVYVAAWQGNFMTWGAFLLNCHSVEFIDPNQKVFDHPMVRTAGRTVTSPYFKVRYVQGSWMEVMQLDSNFEATGKKTWIRWKTNGKLLIHYNLFS